MADHPHPTRLFDVGRIARLESDVAELMENMSDVKEAVVEHRLRLENGSHVFGEIRDDVESNSQKIAGLQPKPASISKVVSLTLAVVMAGGGAIWLLSNMLHERPTREQVDQSISSRDYAHEAAGHKELRNDVDDIKTHQAVQKKLIEDVGDQQDRDSDKLDAILERMPRRRR